MKKRFILITLFVIAAIGAAIFVFSRDERAQTPTPVNTENSAPKDASEQPKGFNKTRHSLEEPASLWVIVNKQRTLPADYRPADLSTPAITLNPRKSTEENQLRAEPAEALQQLFKDTEAQGFKLMLASGFRSGTLQATYYNSYVARDGQAAADRYSARPGTSEHQTGLAVDIARADRQCYLETCFGELPESKWLTDNAHTYGFILRYPENKETVTGYQYEPWHFRYVGKDLAGELYGKKLTMEEFFEL